MPPAAIHNHLLTQAVFNLVQNAANAISSMSVDSSFHGMIRVAVSFSEADGMIRLVISDNGPGMTAEVKAHCIEPFFTTKTRRMSTGLGLAVVHGIVQRAKGTLEIESAPGAGATFIIRLPAVPVARGAVGVQGTARIDVADARIRALVVHELSSLNFAIVNGHGAQTAGEQLLVIDACEGRRVAAHDFLLRNPRAHVIVVGCEPSDSACERVIEIGPVLKREALRQSLQYIATQTKVTAS
jgi:hypothetical protein